MIWNLPSLDSVISLTAKLQLQRLFPSPVLKPTGIVCVWISKITPPYKLLIKLPGFPANRLKG